MLEENDGFEMKSHWPAVRLAKGKEDSCGLVLNHKVSWGNRIKKPSEVWQTDGNHVIPVHVYSAQSSLANPWFQLLHNSIH